MLFLSRSCHYDVDWVGRRRKSVRSVSCGEKCEIFFSSSGVSIAELVDNVSFLLGSCVGAR